MDYKGYHGTERKYKDSIVKSGFYPSNEGWFGQGIYFFGDMLPYVSGFEKAVKWVSKVKKINKYVIFEALISSQNYVDLINDERHKALFRQYHKELVQKHRQSNKSPESFRDNLIYKLIEQEVKCDFIIAAVDSKTNYGFPSYTIIDYQIQICVKNSTCVYNIKLIKEV